MGLAARETKARLTKLHTRSRYTTTNNNAILIWPRQFSRLSIIFRSGMGALEINSTALGLASGVAKLPLVAIAEGFDMTNPYRREEPAKKDPKPKKTSALDAAAKVLGGIVAKSGGATQAGTGEAGPPGPRRPRPRTYVVPVRHTEVCGIRNRNGH